MRIAKPTIAVTGAAGNLGTRLLPLLADYNVIALDMRAPEGHFPAVVRFEPMDLGKEESCDRLIQLFRDHDVTAVVHLAFVLDPQRAGIFDVARMWRINVAGTARVAEAITEVNRLGGNLKTFVALSSVSAYGPELPGEVGEAFPLGAHTLTYAVHKKEADQVLQRRAPLLGGCTTYLLRPHIFVGQTMQNYMVGALRGTPTGSGKWGARLRRNGMRLPMLLPLGDEYLQKKFQFVHVDDVARLIAHLLAGGKGKPGLEILNVAGRGEPLSMIQCAEIANAKILRLPTRALCKFVLKALWRLGISAVPPDAFPYICGAYVMDTSKLQGFLGAEYRRIIRYTVAEALADSFVTQAASPQLHAAAR